MFYRCKIKFLCKTHQISSRKQSSVAFFTWISCLRIQKPKKCTGQQSFLTPGHKQLNSKLAQSSNYLPPHYSTKSIVIRGQNVEQDKKQSILYSGLHYINTFWLNKVIKNRTKRLHIQRKAAAIFELFVSVQTALRIFSLRVRDDRKDKYNGSESATLAQNSR